MIARIYQPARNAMQSGQAKTTSWVLEFAPNHARVIDPLMGWTGSGDTQRQIRLTFETSDAAIEHAKKQGYAYQVIQPQKRAHRPRSYSENFSYQRKLSWTH